MSLSGVYLVTPSATRWNSLYDNLQCFLKHYKNLECINSLASNIGLPALKKEDIDILSEYAQVLEPLSKVLDIFQGNKSCFLGIGVVLPLIEKIKRKLTSRNFPNLNPIRDKILGNSVTLYHVINEITSR